MFCVDAICLLSDISSAARVLVAMLKAREVIPDPTSWIFVLVGGRFLMKLLFPPMPVRGEESYQDG